MSYDHKHRRFCDECGRLTPKPTRIHLGNDYCSTCYARTFVRRTCGTCAGNVRVHKNAVEPFVCGACERRERLCLRCGKPAPIAGRLVDGGAVCGSCAPHYSEIQDCPQCAKPSSRLSRSPSQGIRTKVCDGCRAKATHASCSRCRRFRPVAERLADGKAVCASCLPGSEQAHPCPDCGSEVLGSGTGRCRFCINRAVVRSDASKVAPTLEGVWCQTLWSAYVEHRLSEQPDSPMLRKNLQKDVEFFRLLGATFKTREQACAAGLGRAVSSKVLRKHLVASRFVVRDDSPDDVTMHREARVESERICNVLARAESKPYASILSDYRRWLGEQHTLARTMRMYLTTAQVFCEAVKAREEGPWSQDAIVVFLRRHAGLAANLGRFVTFCQRRRTWDVQMPEKSLWKGYKSKERDDVKKLREAVESMDGRDPRTWTTKELARVLSTALGIPAAELVRNRVGAHLRHADGSVHLGPDAVIGTAHPMRAYALRWAELADAQVARMSRRMASQSPKIERAMIAALRRKVDPDGHGL